MNAVIFHGVGDVNVETVPDPELHSELDAIVRITASAIGKSDVRWVHDPLAGLRPGMVLGHQGVGVVEDVGGRAGNFQPGDRVALSATVGCGSCDACHNGCYSQCDTINPQGPDAGPVYFGGPGGSVAGTLAEYARVPFARVNMVRVPDALTDEEALTACDVFTTGYFAAATAGVRRGETVAVFGCNPSGLFAIVSSKFFEAERVIAIDSREDRLDIAKQLGAEIVNSALEDPARAVRELTKGRGADRVLETDDLEESELGPVNDDLLTWAVRAARKCGVVSIVGAYPRNFHAFPMGESMRRNLDVHAGTCDHRRYMSRVLALLESGAASIEPIVSMRHTAGLEALYDRDATDREWSAVDWQYAAPTTPIAANA